ncbi:MAG TPA: outer membrane beta-barrel protein [Beijerinckiaceae bacterium]|nr:outer membrane beta-barrel protein [Beijerinckiaceae bacterium]
MNRILMGALLACGATFATGAMAADLPARVEAPAPYIAPVPIFTWTGFYVGAVAGGEFDPSNTNATFTPNFVGANLNPTANTSNTHFTGGLEAGYNMQVSSFVFGLEGDVDYLGGVNNLDGNYISGFYGPYTISGGTNHVMGTIRGRLGFAVNRALFYVTGGAAFGGDRLPDSVTVAGLGFTRTTNNNSVGAVLGGGIEYAFTNSWSAKVEYLHTFYGKGNVVYANGPNTFTLSNYSFDQNIIRAGLNYHF